jgi:hypothetical protein
LNQHGKDSTQIRRLTAIFVLMQGLGLDSVGIQKVISHKHRFHSIGPSFGKNVVCHLVPFPDCRAVG